MFSLQGSEADCWTQQASLLASTQTLTIRSETNIHYCCNKPIYITARNLQSAVSSKSFTWRVLGMLPALKKKPTVAQSNAWHDKPRLRLDCIMHA